MKNTHSADEENALDEDLARAIEEKNFPRAVLIARRMNRPAEELLRLQEQAIRQFIVDYRNPQGVQSLVKEYQFSTVELERIARSIVQEFALDGASGNRSSKIQFDVGTMRFLSLDEWIKRYVLLRK